MMGKKSSQNPKDEITEFFSESENDIKIPWCHGGYKIWYNIKRFFSSPLKPVKAKEELNLITQVEILLQSDSSSNTETINKCAQLIALHRHMENTSARRRLEKWAKRVISIYLIIVLIIFILNGVKYGYVYSLLSIDTSLMIVLLSTTTINIIGLGLIVLRGHFEQKKQENDVQKEINNVVEKANPPYFTIERVT